jgi:hypothetical protein
MAPVEQEMHVLPVHLNAPQFLVGFMLLNILLISLSVLRFMVSDYPFGSFKLSLTKQNHSENLLDIHSE